MGQAAGAGIVRIRINGSGLNQTFTDCLDGCVDSPHLDRARFHRVPVGGLSRRWMFAHRQEERVLNPGFVAVTETHPRTLPGAGAV